MYDLESFLFLNVNLDQNLRSRTELHEKGGAKQWFFVLIFTILLWHENIRIGSLDPTRTHYYSNNKKKIYNVVQQAKYALNFEFELL